MDPDREHRVEAGDAEPERRDTDHLERDDLPQRRAAGRRGGHRVVGGEQGHRRRRMEEPGRLGQLPINKQNMSSPSPVTDGSGVSVLTGLGVLKGFDLKGKELWARDIQKDYGRFGLNWGYASSPLLPGCAVHSGAARNEDRRPLLSVENRQEDGQDDLEDRASHESHSGIAGRVYDAGPAAARRRHRDRDLGRRHRHGA